MDGQPPPVIRDINTVSPINQFLQYFNVSFSGCKAHGRAPVGIGFREIHPRHRTLQEEERTGGGKKRDACWYNKDMRGDCMFCRGFGLVRREMVVWWGEGEVVAWGGLGKVVCVF